MTKGERIRQLRISKGISQSDLAKHLNTTKQTISKYEKGIVTNIPSDKVEAMAMLFGSTPQYILCWDEEDKKGQPTETDGLSEKRKALIDFAMSVPEDKAEMILQVMKTILKND